MSKLSRDRGNRFEYRLVYTGRKLGLDLEIHRQPSSGASDMHKLDVIIKGTNIDISLEAKYRKDGGGFKKLYSFSDYKDEIVILNNEYCIIEFNNYLAFTSTLAVNNHLGSKNSRYSIFNTFDHNIWI